MPGDKSVVSYCEVVMKSIELKKKEGAAAAAKELAEDDDYIAYDAAYLVPRPNELFGALTVSELQAGCFAGA